MRSRGTALQGTETGSRLADEGIPYLLWNTKIHNHMHNSAVLVPNLSQINPAHSLAYHLFQIHFNSSVLPSTPRSLKCSLTLFPIKIVSVFLISTLCVTGSVNIISLIYSLQ
jgi:hypothetical protein